MRKIKRLLITLMTAVLLVSIAAPAAYAASDGALNGDSGKWSEFNESVYDAVTTVVNVKDGLFDWPSSGKVLLKVASTQYTLTGSEPNCIGITIPAGLIVDIYKYYPHGDTYTLLGHFDTIDGQAVTIGKNTGKPDNTGNTGTKETIRAPKRVFVPGMPSESYKNSYTDVPVTHWAYHPIMTMTDGGLLGGYGNGKFGPDNTLTRAQVAVIHTRLNGNGDTIDSQNRGDLLGYELYKDNAPATRAFAAVWIAGRFNDSHNITCYNDETIALNAAGGVEGGMQNSITTMSNGYMFSTTYRNTYDIWYANQLAGRNIKPIKSIDELPDAAEIHKWCSENCGLMRKILIRPSATDERVIAECEQAICRAYNLGMLGGVDGKGTFDPYGELTRAQMCQMLYNVGLTYDGVLDYDE